MKIFLSTQSDSFVNIDFIEMFFLEIGECSKWGKKFSEIKLYSVDRNGVRCRMADIYSNSISEANWFLLMMNKNSIIEKIMKGISEYTNDVKNFGYVDCQYMLVWACMEVIEQERSNRKEK